jgi:hypothetical protein
MTSSDTPWRLAPTSPPLPAEISSGSSSSISGIFVAYVRISLIRYLNICCLAFY